MEVSPESIVIGEMQPSHVAVVSEIEAEVSQEPWSRKLFADEFTLSPDVRFWLVATCEDEVVGFGGVMFLPQEACILNLGVASQMMRKGIASQLLDGLFVEMKRRGSVETVHLEVREENVAAKALYKKFGFVEIGKRKNYYGKGAHASLLSLFDFS